VIPGVDVGDLANITIRDLRDLEGVIGKPIGSLFQSLAGGDMSSLDAETLAGLFWLRLRKDDPELSLDDVLDLDLGALGPDAGPKATAGPTA
jgi:hypothetical protein